MQLIIFTVRKDIQGITGGSSIRIKGYTRYLKELGVSYKFVAPVRPDYVDSEDYVSFSLSTTAQLFIKIHNILRQVTVLRFLSSIMKHFILKNPDIKKLAEVSKDTYILSHQNGSIALFLKLTNGQKFIYDVHGIPSLHKGILQGRSLRNKLFFYLALAEEKYFYEYTDVINTTSEDMANFINSNFKTAARFAIAPDGLLKDDFNEQLDMGKVKLLENQLGIKQGDKVLFFAGNFKKSGGVHRLVEAFCELAGQMNNLKLLLVGKGQMRNYIIKRIKAHKLEERFIHIEQIVHSLLPYYQQLATLIICPDIENKYNELVPHIKFFDSIASGKPVIATKFKILEELITPNAGLVRYSKSSSVNDLKQTIADSIFQADWFHKADNGLLSTFTYKKLSKKLVEQYRALGVLS